MFNKIVILLLLTAVVSCRKADQYAEVVNDQPYLVTTQLGLVKYGLGVYPGYLTSYLTGDTAILLGKFFLNRPGSQIRVGNDIAKIAFATQVNAQPDSINEYTGKAEKLDYVKFVITPSMGIGVNIPVTIQANGVVLQAPSISIQSFAGTRGRTDTTLRVDSLGAWMPTNISLYQKNGASLVMNSSVSREGVLCFNNLTDVFLLQNGAPTRLMGSGDHVAGFVINKVLGTAISIDGDSLSFSAEVLENIPDTATSFIFRLCKMDLASGAIRTINRTMVPKGKATVNGPVGNAQGIAVNLPLIAVNLKTDINGAVYFINYYAPARTDFDMTAFYNNGLGMLKPPVYYPKIFGNVCRVDETGMVTSLFTQQFPFEPSIYTLPGFPSAELVDYLVSVDGKIGFACDKLSPVFTPSFAEIGLDQGIPLFSTGFYSTFRFFSYDTSILTGYPYQTWGFGAIFQNQYSLSNYLLLPDGTELASRSYSIAAVNWPARSFYCYAGTERGLGGNFIPGHSNTTGPAKYVSFYGLSFIGIDKLGAIYYFTGGSNYTKGLSFYKLYPGK